MVAFSRDHGLSHRCRCKQEAACVELVAVYTGIYKVQC